MGVPTKYYTFEDGQTAAGLITAARLNGNLDALFNCLDPAAGGLEDTNVKAGAKIVCSDRNYTTTAKITGTWEFSVFPTVPDASIPDAKLSANVMLVSTHGSQLVTNGDSHDHVGGDGAAIPEGGLSLSDVTTADANASRHGLCPKLPNTVTDFLRGDGSWAAPGVDLGYALAAVAAELSAPTDGVSYHFGSLVAAPSSPSGYRRIYIPKAGVIQAVYIFWYASSAAGSGEGISVYVRKNDSADTLVATIANTEARKTFYNAGLSLAVSQGDYIEIKVVCPTWATNPTSVYLGGTIYISKEGGGGGAAGLPDVGAIEYQG